MIASYKPASLYCASLVFTGKKRFRDTLLANCWIVKRMPKNRKFPPDQVLHSESRCYRNDRVRNACNVVPQRYSRQHEYYFVDISWKIGNIAGNAADKTESLGKIRNKSRIILVYGVNKWCKVTE